MRIGLIGDNSIEFVEHLLTIWNSGDCAVLIDWRVPPNNIIALLHEANVAYCYVDELYTDLYQNHSTTINFITYKSQAIVTSLPESIMDLYKANYSENEAVVMYSSGTTGACKGIILSYRAINLNADAIVNYMHLTEKDSLYITKSLSHSSTLVGELLVSLKTRTKVYISYTILPVRVVLNNIDKFGVTTFCLNPSLLSLYCKCEKIMPHKFQALKTIYVSGSILPVDQMDFFNSVFNNVSLLNVYGLTEAGPRVAAQTLNDINIAGSVGKAIMGVQIKIVPATDISVSRAGLIFVKTPYAFSGYISGAMTKIDQDGWLYTGDIGYLDDHGNLFVLGRYDNMMQVSSHNVFPEQIERIIKTHHSIEDCLVYSIKDNVLGERIVCEYVSSREVDKQELRKHCAVFLASYEIPSEFVNVLKIHYTPNGKKQRGKNGN